MQRPAKIVQSPRLAIAAALVVLSGLLAAGIWAGFMIVAAINLPASFARGPAEVSLRADLTTDQPQFIFFEAERSVPIQPMAVTVIGPSGSPVTVDIVEQRIEYDHDGLVGRAIGRFEPDATGTYQVLIPDAPTGQVAVGPDPSQDFLAASRGPALLAGAAVTVGLLLMVAAVAPRSQSQPSRTTVGTNS